MAGQCYPGEDYGGYAAEWIMDNAQWIMSVNLCPLVILSPCQ